MGLLKGTCRIAAEELGKETASRIAVAAQLRLEQLLRENADEPKALKKHTVPRIYPGIAVYEAMRAEGVAPERAVWYLREYYQRFCKIPAGVIRAALKLPGLYKKVPALLLSSSKKSFSEAAGFVYRFPDHTPGVTCFDIVRCPYYETCKRCGCPEIVPAFCDSDDASYGNMHPKLIWGRTKTIGHGGDCCDFKLTLED